MISKNLAIKLINVDLPEPEAPTNAVIVPFWILKLTSLMTSGSPISYLNDTFLNSTAPEFGFCGCAGSGNGWTAKNSLIALSCPFAPRNASP